MKIKFIILTCEKYHSTRVRAIKQSWGKNQNLNFLSDINIDSEIFGYEYLPKGYENIHFKYSEYFINNIDYSQDWYVFSDDDTYVNVENIKLLLQKYNFEDPLCIGHWGKLNSDATDNDGVFTGFPLHTIFGENTNLPLIYPSGGAGFILSVASMRAINKYLNSIDKKQIPRCYNSDVSIGFWIRNSKIDNIDVEGFWWTNPSELKHNKSIIEKSYTYHYVNEKMMLELFEI
jgi:hypothetical protein